jgi:O-antigen ligase
VIRREIIETAGWWVGCAAAASIPLFVSIIGFDAFRLPKELLLRGFGILSIAILLIWIAHLNREQLRGLLRRRPLWLILAILSWTGLTTLSSSNRSLSFGSLIWAVSTASLFLVLYLFSRERSAAWLWILLLGPGLVNAIVILLQVTFGWSPFELAISLGGRFGSTGLLGNPNDLGAYLPAPLLAAAAGAFSFQRHRVSFSAAAAFILAALLATQTLTAMVAILIGSITLLWTLSSARISPRKLLIALILTGSIAALTVLMSTTLRERLDTVTTSISEGNMSLALSGRLIPFGTAISIFQENPVWGSGPGTFGWLFFDHAVEIQRESASALGIRSVTDFTRINFSEVHNDYLELLAEAGVPALVLFILSLTWVGAVSLKRTVASSERRAFATLLAFPASVTFAVLSLGLFPLQIASATIGWVTLFALCRGWVDADS